MPLHQPKAGKPRKSITNAQRRALRAWFFGNSTEPCCKTHRDASTWWEKVYGYQLNSSTVSEILSYKYAALDEYEPSRLECKRKRDRSAKWEELEKELFSWLYADAMGGTVSGKELRAKATQLWYRLPCYQGLSCPKWSEGWVSRFKARYVRHRQRPGQAFLGQTSVLRTVSQNSFQLLGV